MSRRDLDSFDPPEANPDVRDTVPGARRPRGPGAFVWMSARMGWRWLTRMKTALYLLATLGVLSLVATVVPQDPNVASTADAWRAGEAGPGRAVATLLDGLGAFDMYGSPLFLALLLLLFLSLTACLVPRVRAFWRMARHGRPPASRHLRSHPEQATFTTDHGPAEVEDAVRRELRRRRYRLRAPDAGTGTGVEAPGGRRDVAAEKGIVSREGGSLAFHLSFYVLLVAIVLGQLLGFQGQVGVVEARGECLDGPQATRCAFSDTSLAYWNTSPGRWWSGTDHAGFTLALNEFHIDWVRDPQFAGQPTLFQSDVTVTTDDGRTITDTIGGNDPLVVDGMKIHQLEWGYAPRVVVEADGEVVHDAFLSAVDTSAGYFRTAVKAPRAEPDVGLQVQLFPTAFDEQGNSVADRGLPWADAPAMIVTAHRGDLRLDRVQNVNRLDTTGMQRVEARPVALGQTVELDDGVTVSFPELRRWVGFQVSHGPTDAWLLLGALLLLVGLVPALYAYRRRVWVRAEAAGEHGGTLVTVAGRAFQRPGAFEEEFGELADRLRAATDGRSDDPGDGGPATPADPAPTHATTGR